MDEKLGSLGREVSAVASKMDTMSDNINSNMVNLVAQVQALQEQG
ncbi:MAG: hypothetical protein WCO56_26825 [Verrucomicrobiota bacterium]